LRNLLVKKLNQKNEDHEELHPFSASGRLRKKPQLG